MTTEPSTRPPDAPDPRTRRARDLTYTVALLVPLAAITLGGKVHKLTSIDGVDLGASLAGVGIDLVALPLLGLALFGLFSVARRGVARGCALAVAHTLVFGLSLLAVVEHGFFVATGSLLDAYVLGYGLAHMGPLSDVYLSEMSAPTYAVFVAIIAVHALPWWATRRHRGRPPAVDDSRRARWWAGGAAASLVLGLLWTQLGMPAAAEPLRPNVFLGFLDELLADDAGAALTLDGVPTDSHVVVAPSGADVPKHNVLVVILESVRARSTTVHTPALPTTPHLAAVAERGAVVEEAWTVVPHTSKALVSILCGIFPRVDQPIEEAAPEGLPAPCLGRLLGDRGWRTAFFQPATRRFEERDQLVDNMGFEAFYAAEDLPSEGFERSSYFGLEDDAMLGPTLEWIDASDDAPFFATLLTLAPHHDYSVPSAFDRQDFADAPLLDDYLNTIAYVDRFLGALLDGLEARGLRDDTIVIVVGDHGEGFGEHGRRQHDTVIYEEGLHVPLVIAGPGVAPGARVEGPRQIIDIPPTVLDLLGYDVLRGLPGRSLLDEAGHDELFAACWYRDRCMARRTGDRKFIYHFDRRAPELFDLGDDPMERHDLIAAGALDEAAIDAEVDALMAWRAASNARFATRFERRFKGDYVSRDPPDTAHPRDVRFGDVLRLAGVDLERAVLGPDDPLVVTHHWEVLAPPGERLRAFTHILGTSPGAKPMTNADHEPLQGRYPMSEWRAGTFVSDRHTYSPIEPLPPGTYEIVVGVYDVDGRGLDARLVPDGDAARLGDDRYARSIRFEVRAE